jgi:hypothetical protein
MEPENQPALTLLVFDRDEPRMYAQSTFGQSSSTRAFRSDSRSMAMAKASEQGLQSYAILDRCPALVPHRSAKSSRSGPDRPSQKDLKDMTGFHHTVIPESTPFREFTKWCGVGQTVTMGIKEIKALRVENLRILLDRDFGGNQTALAKLYNPKNPKPAQINDLLNNVDRSFGEKLARKLEEVVGLVHGQLDIPNSPLLYQPGRAPPVLVRLPDLIKDLTVPEQSKVIDFIGELKRRRKKAG